MERILAIDYGRKRCGIAVSDPLQIIAGGLPTVETPRLREFLRDYMSREPVGTLVIGLPLHADGTSTELETDIQELIRFIHKLRPGLPVARIDEAFTSTRAKQVILDSGARKQKRRDKALVDKVSAVLILQEYMERHR